MPANKSSKHIRAQKQNATPSSSGVDEERFGATGRGANGAVGLLAGPFRDQVAVIWGSERRAEYLCATDGRRQVWHAWLAASSTEFSEHSPMSSSLAYRQLTSDTGKTLVAMAYGECPAGAMNVLGKLGPAARDPIIYQGLMKVLAHSASAGAKLLRHAAEISDDLVLSLATLPAGMGSNAIFEVFRAGRLPGEALGYFSWTLARLEALSGPEMVARILSSSKPLVAMRKAILEMAFPDPPWQGSALLEPLTSEAALHQAAEDFANCLTGAQMRSEAVLKVLSRRRYFYRWWGEQPALLAFTPVAKIGWYLQEASGQSSVPLSQQTLDEIGRELEASACLCPISADNWVLSDGRLYWEY